MGGGVGKLAIDSILLSNFDVVCYSTDFRFRQVKQLKRQCQTISDLCIPQKDLTPSLIPKYQLNICNENYKLEIMIFWREVQYLMQLFSCQHREQNIFKRNYEITVVILWRRVIFLDYNYKDCPLNLSFTFLKYIFGIEVWLIPFGIM